MHKSALTNIIIDCDDLEKGVTFWSAALGLKVTEQQDPYVCLELLEGGLELCLQKVPEPKTAKNRVHLDIRSSDIEAEVKRLEALGAKRAVDMGSWWVMTDPCGNEFCVIG